MKQGHTIKKKKKSLEFSISKRDDNIFSATALSKHHHSQMRYPQGAPDTRTGKSQHHFICYKIKNFPL